MPNQLRLFDNGHSLVDAWAKVREANPDDTLMEEVLAYVQGILKDVTTEKGLPFATLDKESYEPFAESVCQYVPGVSKEWLYDLMSFDAMEVIAGSLGAVCIIFALKNDDTERLSEMLGSMGIVSITSANPIMGVVVVAAAAFSYNKSQTSLDGKSVFVGASTSIISATLFSVMGFPILVELVIVLIATSLLRKHVLTQEDLLGIIERGAKSTGSKVGSMFEDVLSALDFDKKKSA